MEQSKSYMSFVARKSGLSLFTGMSFFIMSSDELESIYIYICVCASSVCECVLNYLMTSLLILWVEPQLSLLHSLSPSLPLFSPIIYDLEFHKDGMECFEELDYWVYSDWNQEYWSLWHVKWI